MRAAVRRCSSCSRASPPARAESGSRPRPRRRCWRGHRRGAAAGRSPLPSGSHRPRLARLLDQSRRQRPADAGQARPARRVHRRPGRVPRPGRAAAARRDHRLTGTRARPCCWRGHAARSPVGRPAVPVSADVDYLVCNDACLPGVCHAGPSSSTRPTPRRRRSVEADGPASPAGLDACRPVDRSRPTWRRSTPAAIRGGLGCRPFRLEVRPARRGRCASNVAGRWAASRRYRSPRPAAARRQLRARTERSRRRRSAGSRSC